MEWFYDELDGKYSFGINEGERYGTHTVFVHDIIIEK